MKLSDFIVDTLRELDTAKIETDTVEFDVGLESGIYLQVSDSERAASHIRFSVKVSNNSDREKK